MRGGLIVLCALLMGSRVIDLPLQRSQFDCGPVALHIWLSLRYPEIAARPAVQQTLERHSEQTLALRRGLSVQQVIRLGESVGVPLRARYIQFDELQPLLPLLVYLEMPAGAHFSVRTRILAGPIPGIELTDPAGGVQLISQQQFFQWWQRGIALSDWLHRRANPYQRNGPSA